LAAYNLVKPLSTGNERSKQEMDADGNIVDKKQEVRFPNWIISINKSLMAIKGNC